MGTFIEDMSLRDRLRVFADRRDAGRQLAKVLLKYRNTNTIVMAIPAGGVPVAAELATALHLPADLVIVRKIQMPDNPEAGIGAMSPDGEMILNVSWVARLHITKDEIIAQKQKTLDTIQKREQTFRKKRPYHNMRERTVILVDDGLASGYTMLVAVDFMRSLDPLKVVIAVPTASNTTVDMLLPKVEELVCLNVRRGNYFAVADAYRNWYDLGDEEVLSIIGAGPFQV
ncbi:MAG: phosphoribosyltransferase [ANME-2 cluster archaeon]|nr:phosphoribosyltransferase [ANME-2 cluster archaeon]